LDRNGVETLTVSSSGQSLLPTIQPAEEPEKFYYYIDVKQQSDDAEFQVAAVFFRNKG